MERMGKGLLWNAATPTPAPVVFMPLTIGVSAASPLGTWPTATSSSASDTDYEVIGPQVFRFEYCYLGTGGTLSITPPADVSGIAAIVVDIAVIDPKSKVLISDCLLAKLNGAPPPPSCNQSQQRGLVDYAANNNTLGPGKLLANWRSVIDTNTIGLPRLPVSGIRLYERCFYLSPPTL